MLRREHGLLKKFFGLWLVGACLNTRVSKAGWQLGSEIVANRRKHKSTYLRHTQLVSSPQSHKDGVHKDNHEGGVRRHADQGQGGVLPPS